MALARISSDIPLQLPTSQDFMRIRDFLDHSTAYSSWRAGTRGLLTSLHSPAIQHRISLYVSDMVAFLVPTAQDIRAARSVLDIFAQTSRLETNVSKCKFTPIRCTEQQIALVQHMFPCQLIPFPCNYLGIPVSVYALKKSELLPLVDRVIYGPSARVEILVHVQSWPDLAREVHVVSHPDSCLHRHCSLAMDTPRHRQGSEDLHRSRPGAELPYGSGVTGHHWIFATPLYL
jgi:hypothetical protein